MYVWSQLQRTYNKFIIKPNFMKVFWYVCFLLTPSQKDESIWNHWNSRQPWHKHLWTFDHNCRLKPWNLAAVIVVCPQRHYYILLYPFWVHLFTSEASVSWPYLLIWRVSCWISTRSWDCAGSWHCSLAGLWRRTSSRAWAKLRQCSFSVIATWRSSLFLCWQAISDII